MTDKIYCGNAKEHIFKDGGKALNISFSKKDLQIMLANLNEKGWINLNVCRRKKPSEFGQTHYIAISDFVPNKKNSSSDSETVSGKDCDNLPF